MILCKDDACPPWRLFEPQRNVLSRVGPLPGARGDAIRVDWLISAIYGEDAVFWKTKGFDDWRWDAGSRDKLALTQWFLDIYLPIGAGASVLLGSFQNPLALEVGYGSFVPPNWFASRSYAFVAGPSKQVGALAQFKLPLAPALGVASASVGVVSDWNSFDLGAGAPMPGFIGIVSWRSPDLATWLDVEFMYANGEDDFGDVTRVDDTLRPLGGGTQYLALSSTDEVLDRFIGYVTLVHAFDQRTRIALEAVYGHQEAGDRAPLPFTITRHSPFYGVNVAIRRQLHERVHVGLRAEWFADDHAASILWSGVGATGGDVYALTASLAWEPSPHVLLRPELKFDVYAGGGHLFATARDGRAREDAQLLGVVNLELRF